jgi:hypothetical protein
MTSDLTAAELLRRVLEAGADQVHLGAIGSTVTAIVAGAKGVRSVYKSDGSLIVDGPELVLKALQAYRSAP